MTLGLTWPRPLLRARIHERLTRRVREGLVDEVEGLLQRGVPAAKLTALGLEYRHVVRLLEGSYGSQEELVQRLDVAIGAFARRQMIWFKRDPSIHWLNANADYVSEAMRHLTAFLGHRHRVA